MNTPAPTAAAPSQEDAAFIKSIVESPIVAGVKSGDNPPLYASPSVFGPDAATIIPRMQKVVTGIGLGLTMAPKSGVVVLFNPAHYHEQEILKADAAGTLDQIALPLQPQGGDPSQGAPAGAPDPSAAAGAAPQQSPAPSIGNQLFGGGAPAPSGADPAQAARLAAQQPQPPVKRPMPSQGILNSLTSRAM